MTKAVVLKARYVFPVTAAPIRDGAMAIQDGRIVAVGRSIAITSDAASLVDLGNVALLPGLINAHTHLEFSDLPAPLGTPGIGLVDWIGRLMEYRRTLDSAAVASAVRHGLSESVGHGTVALGEIAQPGWPPSEITAADPAITLFLELIAPTAARVEGAIAMAREFIRAADLKSQISNLKSKIQNPKYSRGLSPHSPYTVHPALLQAVAALSAEHRVPLAMHLAESQEEMELLQSGSGPLRDLLEARGAWDGTVVRPGARPLDYLRTLECAHRLLVIHGNYLDAEEIAFLSARRRQMAVIYCPRTHAWFVHAPYPLQELISAGVTVGLGTDGRGSSPDLSILAEMRAVVQRHPQVARETVLRLGTLGGAAALGLDSQLGSLEPGKAAALIAIALPDGDAADPHDLLLTGQGQVVARWERKSLNRKRSAFPTP